MHRAYDNNAPPSQTDRQTGKHHDNSAIIKLKQELLSTGIV